MGVENNIPEGWVTLKLDELSERVCVGFVGTCHKDYTKKGIGVPMIRTTNLKDRGLDLRDVQYISEEFHLKQKKSQLKKGDILIARHGVNGLSCLYNSEDEANCLNVVIVRANQKITDYKWLISYINSPTFRHQVNAYSTGSVQKVVNTKALANFIILAPTLKEQKAIAKVLAAFDDKIELLQAQNKTLEAMAQTIFKEWFGKYQVGDKLPEGWRVGKLGDKFDITIGRTPPRKETQWFSDKPIGKKWISIKDIGNCGTFIYNTAEHLSDEAIEKFNIPIIPANTTILSFKMTVGKLTITTEDMLSNEAIAHLKIKNDSNLSSEFIYLYLRDLNFNTLGSTSSIVTAINSTIIKGINFIIPKDSLLKSFQKRIIPVFEKIQNNTSQIQSLTKTRDTLLPKLMSGQVRVNNIKQRADA